MNKFILLAFSVLSFQIIQAQTDTTNPAVTVTTPPAKKDWSKVNLSNRSGDHLLVQIGHDGWAGKPDSIRVKGLSRSVNVYFMIDFPFKTDPRWSVAIGAGVSSSNIYFDKTTVEIAGSSARLNFRNVADTNQFKKFKLSTNYVEAPLELRFAANPERSSGSFKVAIGAKIGTMVNAHTKGKNFQNKAGNSINSYTVKETSKRYFNSTRLSGTTRIGYGNFSLFGSYQITNLLKDGVGPVIHPYTIGLTLSGL
jgi:hypothetical protein